MIAIRRCPDQAKYCAALSSLFVVGQYIEQVRIVHAAVQQNKRNMLGGYRIDKPLIVRALAHQNNAVKVFIRNFSQNRGNRRFL